MNDLFQEYKRQYQKCEVVLVDEIVKPDFEINFAEVEATDKIKMRRLERRKRKQEDKKILDEFER